MQSSPVQSEFILIFLFMYFVNLALDYKRKEVETTREE